MLSGILKIENDIAQQRKIIFEEKAKLANANARRIADAEKQIEIQKTELKKIVGDIRAKKEEKQAFAQLRQEINGSTDKLKTIASIDGFFTIPVFLLLVKDICKTNEADLAKAFHRWCGKELGFVFKTEDINEILKQGFGNTIKVIFETFINKQKIENLTTINLNKLIKQTAEYFLDSSMVKPLATKADKEVKGILLNLLQTEIFLQMLYELYAEADRKQHEAIAKLIKELVFVNGDYFRKPFLAINLTLDVISIYENTVDLWGEIALWIEGFYRRTYNMIPPIYKNDLGQVKREGDSYPTIDGQDNSLKTLKGVTKYEIALYQKTMCELLAGRVATAKKNPQEFTLPPWPTKQPPDERVLEIVAKVKKTHASANGILQVFEDGAFIQIVAAIPKKMQPLADHLEIINKSKLTTTRQIVDDSIIQLFLNQYQNESLANKVNALDACFKMFELTAMQLKLLGFIPDEIKMYVVRFLNDKAKSWLGSSEHVSEATKLLDTVNSNVYHNPVELFQGLLALQKVLNNDDSQNLLPKINLIFLAIFDYMRMGVLVTTKKPELLFVSKPINEPKQKQAFFSSKKEDKSKNALPKGVYTCEKNEFIYVVTNIEKTNLTLAQHIKEINEITLYGKFQVDNFNSIAEDLLQFKDAEPADKTRRFLFCLDTFNLHSMQITMLNFASSQAESHYKMYLKEEKHPVWGWVYVFNKDQRRKHSPMIEEQLKEIETKHKEVESANFFMSLKGVMITLYQDNSSSLQSKVQDIFMDGFTHLSKVIDFDKTMQQNQQPFAINS